MIQTEQAGFARWIVKGSLFWIVFMILYFAYKLFPHPPLGSVCATTDA
jgi:hypothetical protein